MTAAQALRATATAAAALPIEHPALRYFGGKFRAADWIIQHFPPHRCYVEPYGGAASVLLRKAPVYAEVYNDLDRSMVNFFEVLRDPVARARLIEACALTPYARAEFDAAWEPSDDPVESARRTAVRAQMGFGSAGAAKGVTGFRSDTRRSYSTAQHEWARYPSAISAVGERFTGVLVECRPGLEIMRQHDTADTLHLVDPPYVHATRVMRTQGGYRHEMSDADHVELLEVLGSLQGMVVLCGYPNSLYERGLPGWTKRTRRVAASGGRGGVSRTEVLWLTRPVIRLWCMAPVACLRKEALMARDPSDRTVAPLTDAPMNPAVRNGDLPHLRGWLVMRSGCPPQPCAQDAAIVVAWPCSLPSLAQHIAAQRADFENSRGLLLAWGEHDSAVPTYAALGLRSSMSLWFVDRVSAASLLGPIDELVDADLMPTDGRHSEPARSRLAPLIESVQRLVPAAPFDLEGDATIVARWVALYVVGLERGNCSHSKCLDMMSRSAARSSLDPRCPGRKFMQEA